MFHNRTLNNKINRLHERVLRLVYDDENLSFQELLELDNSMTIHHRNLQKLAIEMFKIKNNLCPIPMKEIFKDYVNTYDLRNKRCWETCKVKTVFYNTETIRYQGPKTCSGALRHCTVIFEMILMFLLFINPMNSDVSGLKSVVLSEM